MEQLEAQLKDSKVSNDIKNRELDEPHRFTRLESSKTQREVAATVVNEKKDVEQKLSVAWSTIEAKEKEVLKLRRENSEISAQAKDYISQKKPKQKKA